MNIVEEYQFPNDYFGGQVCDFIIETGNILYICHY